MTPSSRLTTLSLLFAAGTTFAADIKTPAGTEFKDCAVCPVMVVVPAGSFMMGSPGSEANRVNDEDQHKVTISKPFAIGKFEVTQVEFKAFVDETGYKAGEFAKFSNHRNDPAVAISYNDAALYADWLSYKTGSKYRVPTEAEWEYAARANTSTAYPFPSFAIHKHANINGKQDGFDYVAPVGSFPANKFGLHDMHGNVYEWTQDCSGVYTNAPTDGSASFTGDCNWRKVRGGSYKVEPAEARSAARVGIRPDSRYYENGFRLVRTL